MKSNAQMNMHEAGAAPSKAEPASTEKAASQAEPASTEKASSKAEPTSEATAGNAAQAGNAHTPAAVLWPVAFAVTLGGTMLRFITLSILAVANDDNVWGLLNKWDAEHYVRIAREGYSGEEYAFFPGLPMLMRALGNIGFNLTFAGIFISFVAVIFLAAGVMALVERLPGKVLRGHNGQGHNGQAHNVQEHNVQERTVPLLAAQVAAAIVVTCAPMSMVFIMPYTEALFGALAVWALVALHDRAWPLAGFLVFLLGFVRLTSIDMVAVFGLWVLVRGRKDWRAWAALVVSVIPLAGYLTWANQHLPRGYFALQRENWNSTFDFGRATLRWLWNTLTSSNDLGYLLSTMVMIAVVVGLVAARGRLPLVAWLFVAALAANILLSDGLMHSRPRLLLPAALLLVPWAVWAIKHMPRGWAWAVIVGSALFGTWVGGQMLAVFEWAI